MAKIQEVFNRIQETKGKQREIKTIFRDALANSTDYREIVDEIKKLKEKKKEIENNIKMDFTSELDKLDRIKLDLETDNILLSDIALNHIVEGESLEITDKDQVQYEPIFSVKFRKIN